MKNKQQVGIDLGSSAVRVVAVSGTDKHGMPRVVAIAATALPPGAIVGSRINHPDIVVAAIKETLKKVKLPRYGAVVGLSTTRVALNTVQLPEALKPREWGNVLRLEGYEASPLLKSHESYLGFSRIPVTENTDPGTVLLSVSAVRQEDVDLLMATCRRAGVTPRAVDLAAAATFRGLTAVPAGDQSGTSSLVDVGATTTTVATRSGQRLRYVRLIDEGAASVSLALKGALSLKFEQAEELKKTIRVGSDAVPAPRSSAARALASAYGNVDEDSQVVDDDDPAVIAVRAATVAANAIVEKIANAIESDTAQHQRQPTTSITLCGRGALLPGLAALVESRIGVPTSVRRPYIHVEESARTRSMFIDGAVDPARLLEITTATGLAMWKGES